MQAMLRAWNWKSALVSAVLRGVTFFATNLRGGHGAATKAMLVEAGFAIFAAGMMGAATQRLRSATPVWAAALAVWLGLPGLMVAAQYGVHHLAGTHHVKVGLIASFCFASLASGFNWFAQRRGVMLAGEGSGGDLRAMPGVVWEFVSCMPRALTRRGR